MKTRYQYNYGINFLRTVAITGVVLYHMFPIEVRGGYLGVCLFFLISGYLTGQKTETDHEDGIYTPRRFYIRRFVRLYPPLYVMVMTVVAFLTLFHKELLVGIREEVAVIFLSIDNWWQIATQTSYFMKTAEHSPFLHLWYLSVEVQLLLLWPLLFFCYRKLKEKAGKRAASWLFLILAAVSAVLMGVQYRPDALNRAYYGTDTRAFAFFLGVFFGLREDGLQEKAGKYFGGRSFLLCLAVTLALMAAVRGESPFLYYGGMVLICFWFAFLIFVMNAAMQTEGFVRRMVYHPALQWIGKHSYTIYLWHYPILFLLLMN